MSKLLLVNLTCRTLFPEQQQPLLLGKESGCAECGSPQVSLLVWVSGGAGLAVLVPLHPLLRDSGIPAP